MSFRPISDSAALAAEIIARRNEIMRARDRFLAQRAEATEGLRQADRDLADCRATARFFNIQVDLPDPDELRSHAMRRDPELFLGRPERSVTTAGFEMERARLIEAVAPTTSTPVEEVPPLKEFLLSELMKMSTAGAKAAGLRALYEETFNRRIHEKTVGMTLYRLLRQNEVHRDGHVWFHGPLTADRLVDRNDS